MSAPHAPWGGAAASVVFHPSDPIFPAAVPTDILFMQGVFQELWGLFAVLVAVATAAYLAPLLLRWSLPATQDGIGAFRGAVKHLAVIMDGNRRYGQAKYGSATKGHWDGGKTLSNFIDWCLEADIEVLTVYAFSTENWNRSAEEIKVLMAIFEHYFTHIQQTAAEKGVRVTFLSSDPTPLPDHIAGLMRAIEEATAAGSRLRLNVCLSYGGRGEIVAACRRIAEEVAAGDLAPEDVDATTLERHLLTAGQPDPDLVLRTSGECRLSNFLLYQLAYAELAFVDKPWPAVTRDDLHSVLRQYAGRTRRYGK